MLSLIRLNWPVVVTMLQAHEYTPANIIDDRKFRGTEDLCHLLWGFRKGSAWLDPVKVFKFVCACVLCYYLQAERASSGTGATRS